MTTPPFRLPVEHMQLLAKPATFTHLNTSDIAETAKNVASSMSEGVKVSFVVDLYDLYVEFNGTATSSSMLVPAGSGYSETGIYVTSISVINVTAGENGRIRGVVWGR